MTTSVDSMTGGTSGGVVDPWWWAAGDARSGPPPSGDDTVPATHHDGLITVRVAPDAAPADLRRVDERVAADASCHTVALDLSRIPDRPALARAVAATRVRLLVRGLRVELVGAPPTVRAAVGPDAPLSYRVVDGPVPRWRRGVRRPGPRGGRGVAAGRARGRSTDPRR